MSVGPKVKSFIAIILLSLVTLLAFQNCGNIKVQNVQQASVPSVQAKGISGNICGSTQPVSAVSRYNLTQFVILNLTALTKDSNIEIDSNINGVLDRIESDPNLVATVKLSNADTDGDGIPDFIEEIRGLTPSRDDLFEDGSDQDGFNNIDEIRLGTDVTSSQSPPELNLYSATEVAPVRGCDASQKSYQFVINNLQRVSTSPLNDNVNLAEASLSHAADENVFLIYAHLQPERVTEPDKKLFKVFKVKKNDTEFFLEVLSSDFKNLPNP